MEEQQAPSESQSKSDSQSLVFTPPKGWTPPESENKKEFDVVCTFCIEDDGRLRLEKLGETEMGKDTDDKKAPATTAPDSKPGYGQYAQGMMGGLGGGGMGGMGAQ